MCGRFTLTVDPEQLAEFFPWVTASSSFGPRYNIAPTQSVAVIQNTGTSSLEFFRWGLVPSWAKDPAIGNRMINARAESLHEKPSFRTALRKRRCLILADGFYEWKVTTETKSKIPMYIRLKTGKVFAFAGLWDAWIARDGSTLHSCAIITTQPNALLSTIHNRMPAILNEYNYLEWLSPGEIDPGKINTMLLPYPADRMEAYPVSQAVNNPANDNPSLIQILKQ